MANTTTFLICTAHPFTAATPPRSPFSIASRSDDRADSIYRYADRIQHWIGDQLVCFIRYLDHARCRAVHTSTNIMVLVATSITYNPSPPPDILCTISRQAYRSQLDTRPRPAPTLESSANPSPSDRVARGISHLERERACKCFGPKAEPTASGFEASQQR